MLDSGSFDFRVIGARNGGEEDLAGMKLRRGMEVKTHLTTLMLTGAAASLQEVKSQTLKASPSSFVIWRNLPSHLSGNVFVSIPHSSHKPHQKCPA